MRYLISLFLIVFSFTAISAQTREQAVKELEALKERRKVLDAIILQLDKTDIEAAARENASVFRILPREKYDIGLLESRGGGAFYSFVKKSNSYDAIPQIGLSRNELTTGFYGASYGFIADLGEISLAEINEETKGINFLANYQPPTEISKARIEQGKGNYGFEEGGTTYKNRFPAIVGHTYVLRAISYGEADILVVFKVYRKDADGSLIIFDKTVKTFETPKLERTNAEQNTLIESAATTDEIAQKIQNALSQKGFSDVTVDYSTTPLTLRGTVPKGKLAEVIQLVQQTSGKPIRNELYEK